MAESDLNFDVGRVFCAEPRLAEHYEQLFYLLLDFSEAYLRLADWHQRQTALRRIVMLINELHHALGPNALERLKNFTVPAPNCLDNHIASAQSRRSK